MTFFIVQEKQNFGCDDFESRICDRVANNKKMVDALDKVALYHNVGYKQARELIMEYYQNPNNSFNFAACCKLALKENSGISDFVKERSLLKPNCSPPS